MKILTDILQDSKTHYLSVQAKIGKRLRELPKGSVQKKRVQRGGDYYYLKTREGDRIIEKYLGKEEPVELKKTIEERRLLKKRLKEVKQNLKILKRLKWEKHAR